MGKHAQLVMGPAGSGKSTYCHNIQQHCAARKRTVHIINLDPAADNFKYKPTIDIRDFITLADVMEELEFGPNGGLVYCMEYFLENIEWFNNELGDYEEDYLIFDCPGQLELYTHIPVMKLFVEELQRQNYLVCGVHILDSHFIDDITKFISGTLLSLSSMVHMELPHVNILSKCDLLSEEQHQRVEDLFLMPDGEEMIHQLNANTPSAHTRLNEAMAELLSEFSLVKFVPLNPADEDSLDYVLSTIDNAIQYGEDLEPKDPFKSETGDENQNMPNFDEDPGWSF